MPNRYEYTGYWQGGRGCGFRGSAPAWPYVGRGRGGMPRCMSPSVYGSRSHRQPGWTAAPATAPAAYGPQWTRDQEMSWLRDEQQFIKNRLEQIDIRIAELGNEKDN